MSKQRLISFVVILLLFPWFFPDALDEISWNVIGPGGGGNLTTIEISSDNPNVVYVGCDVGGIYKSTNNGESWQIINNGFTNYIIYDIAIDPHSPATLYAATAGGVFKSTDNGDTWVIKRNGFPPTAKWSFSSPIAEIFVDPVNPNIVYAGVGIRHQDGHNYPQWINVEEKGVIYKSTDYGESWSKIQNTGININAMIYSMVIDFNDPTVLYVTTEYGVYKSTDAGNTWQSKITGLPHVNTRNIIIDPTNSDVLYVTIWATPGSVSWEGGVYKSTDAGESWAAKNDGLAQAMSDPSESIDFTSNYQSIVINPQDSLVLYVANTGRSPDPGIFKTTDGGNNWTWVTRDTGVNMNIESGWINWTGPLATCLAIDPVNPDRLFFGNMMILCKTENAGESWVQVYTDLIGSGYWQGRGFETTYVWDITVDPTNANNVYFGYADIGFLKSTDGGISFKSTGMTGNNWINNAYVVIVDPAENSILYAATSTATTDHGEIRKSTDYGETWNVIGDSTNGLPDAQVWSLVIDANSDPDSRILYAASYGNGIYKTTDGSVSWFSVNNGLGINRDISRIVIDPANSNILYVGIEAYDENYDGNWTSVQGGIYKTSDGGQNWIRIDTNPPQPSVSDLAINPTNPDIIYSATREMYDHSQQIMYRGGVYKSTDGGNNWIELSSGFGDNENLNVGTLAINPQNPEIIYAGTFDRLYHDECSGRGIFKSTNGGVTWTPINSGLSNFNTNIITIDPSDHSRLYLGTLGNGAFIGIDDVLTNIDDQYENEIQIPEKFYIEQNYPNPFNPRTTISYQLPKSSFVNLSIYNVTGQLVETMVSEYKDVGYHSVIWDASGVGSGLYFYRIEAGEYTETKKCLILK
ncbi:MAG: T9SS type A sorting domain-containing protein [Candidatus Marinimicrobia bacterium]|nr:T9SS type A sorting domain-containing protein [Candidatus Neomarinimicrobiota bacterium]